MDGIVFRTTDGGRWGAAGGTGTGGNLTPLQFDENMWAFLVRMEALESNPPVAVSIASITVIGSTFQVNLTNGTHQGPFNLPIATFNATGNWVNAMTYARLDLVEAPHFGLYMVLIPHTTPVSPALFDPEAVDTTVGSPTIGQPLYQLMFGEDTYIYDLGFFFPGRPGIGIDDGTAIAGHVFVHPVSLPATLDGSEAKLRVGPAAALSFPLKLNATTVGSVDFAIAATVGTFTFAADIAVVAGDVLTVIKPTAVDVDARELSITVKATRTF